MIEVDDIRELMDAFEKQYDDDWTWYREPVGKWKYGEYYQEDDANIAFLSFVSGYLYAKSVVKK